MHATLLDKIKSGYLLHPDIGLGDLRQQLPFPAIITCSIYIILSQENIYKNVYINWRVIPSEVRIPSIVILQGLVLNF